MKKATSHNDVAVFFKMIELYSLHLIGTKAARAYIHMLRSSVHEDFYSLYIGFPGSVGSSVGVGNFDSKVYAFSANITFSHIVTPPVDFVLLRITL